MWPLSGHIQMSIFGSRRVLSVVTRHARSVSDHRKPFFTGLIGTGRDGLDSSKRRVSASAGARELTLCVCKGLRGAIRVRCMGVRDLWEGCQPTSRDGRVVCALESGQFRPVVRGYCASHREDVREGAVASFIAVSPQFMRHPKTVAMSRPTFQSV